jgi:hypothetical protein
MKAKTQQRSKRTGIWIYCDPEAKKRIRHCALDADQTISEYAMSAIMRKVEGDESKSGKKRSKSEPR